TPQALECARRSGAKPPLFAFGTRGWRRRIRGWGRTPIGRAFREGRALRMAGRTRESGGCAPLHHRTPRRWRATGVDLEEWRAAGLGVRAAEPPLFRVQHPGLAKAHRLATLEECERFGSLNAPGESGGCAPLHHRTPRRWRAAVHPLKLPVSVRLE